jgi:2-(1,2-epoxy-1,2-dihydrophenyl)acetyl-CoA isomerase
VGDPLRVEDRGSVRWIVVNRPEALNAFDESLGSAFLDALREASDPSVRCVVVTGEGKAFCAGEDLRALSGVYEQGEAPPLGEILRRRYNPAIVAMQELSKPVVAAVNGVAAGAGVSLALAADYRVMAEEASLILAFSKVGLVPDSGATWLLPRYLGAGKAMEMAFSGGAVTAQWALERGLVNRVVPLAELAAVTEEVAKGLADGPTAAYGLIKRLVWSSFSSRLEDHLEAEANAQTSAGATEDHMEGVKAFVEKRPPRFGGK